MILFSEQQKIDVLHSIIRQFEKRSHSPAQKHELSVLKAIALDCQARIPASADAAITRIEFLMAVCKRQKSRTGYNSNTLVDLAQHIIGFWPTLRAALIDTQKEKETAS